MLADARLLSIIDYGPRLTDENVELQPQIKVRFNLPINHLLVDSDSELNQFVILVRMDEDETVPVSFVSWDLSTRILTFQPSGNLVPGDIYQVTIRKDIQAATGRKMEKERTWVFQVSSAHLGQVTLRQPGDSAGMVQAPTLIWDGVYIPSGSVTYEVQVDSDWLFGTNPLWTTTISVSGSGGIHSTAIGVALQSRAAYYWRVRAYTDTIVGDWSEVRSFWLGSALQPSPDTVQLFEPSAVFTLLDLLPENASTHLTSFPTIRATFSQEISGSSVHSGTFQLFSSTVDQRIGPGTVLMSGASYTVLDNVVDLIPEGSIQFNTRYTIRITTDVTSTSGETLAEFAEQYFVGPYKPFYGGIIGVRASLGGFINQTSDDEISFHMWRASLYTNEVLQNTYNTSLLHTSLNTLINYTPPQGVTYGMQKFTELTAVITLLESHYVDLLAEAGRKRELSVFRHEVDVALLEELRKRILELKKDRDVVGATFLLTAIGPRVAIKSQYWYPDPCYNSRARDWSHPGRTGLNYGNDPLRQRRKGFRREDSF